MKKLWFLFILICELGRVQCIGGKELSLYTSQPHKDIVQLVKKFNELYPDIKINVFRSGSVEVVQKLRAESKIAEPKADILMISDSLIMDKLKQDGFLYSLQDIDPSPFINGTYDNEKFYFGTKKITVCLVYNTKFKLYPQSFKDLISPRFKNNILMADPRYSGVAKLMISILANNSDFGWTFFEDLKSNGVVFIKSNNDVVHSIATAEKSVGISVDFMVKKARNLGAEIDFSYPEEGTIMITEPIAVLNACKNKEVAAVFVNFVLSQEGQKLVRDQGYESILKDLAHSQNSKVESFRYHENEISKKYEAVEEKFSEIFSKA